MGGTVEGFDSLILVYCFRDLQICNTVYIQPSFASSIFLLAYIRVDPRILWWTFTIAYLDNFKVVEIFPPFFVSCIHHSTILTPSFTQHGFTSITHRAVRGLPVPNDHIPCDQVYNVAYLFFHLSAPSFNIFFIIIFLVRPSSSPSLHRDRRCCGLARTKAF